MRAQSETTPRTRPEMAVVIENADHSTAWSWPRPVDAQASAVCRIRQPELRGGIRERAWLRIGWRNRGDNPADLTVALEVDVLIADDAASARSELLRLGEPRVGDTVRYIGTAQGLFSLILDIYTAEVADAVILRPIDKDAVDGSAALIVDQLIPRLQVRATEGRGCVNSRN